MKFITKTLIAVCAASATFAAATSAEIGFQIHGLSHHFTARPSLAGVPWTEVNYGFGLSLRQDELTYLVGAYKNSLSTDKAAFYSRYAIVDYQPITMYSSGAARVSLGGFVGVVHGYPTIEWNKDGSMGRVLRHGFRPALGLAMRAEYNGFNVTFRLVPPRGNASTRSSAVLAVETGYTF